MDIRPRWSRVCTCAGKAVVCGWTWRRVGGSSRFFETWEADATLRRWWGCHRDVGETRGVRGTLMVARGARGALLRCKGGDTNGLQGVVCALLHANTHGLQLQGSVMAPFIFFSLSNYPHECLKWLSNPSQFSSSHGTIQTLDGVWNLGGPRRTWEVVFISQRDCDKFSPNNQGRT